MVSLRASARLGLGESGANRMAHRGCLRSRWWRQSGTLPRKSGSTRSRGGLGLIGLVLAERPNVCRNCHDATAPWFKGNCSFTKCGPSVVAQYVNLLREETAGCPNSAREPVCTQISIVFSIAQGVTSIRHMTRMRSACDASAAASAPRRARPAPAPCIGRSRPVPAAETTRTGERVKRTHQAPL